MEGYQNLLEIHMISLVLRLRSLTYNLDEDRYILLVSPSRLGRISI